MTELHLYFAQCLKTLSGEFTAGLSALHAQLEALLTASEHSAGQAQRSLQSLEQRVALLERKNLQDQQEEQQHQE